MAFYFMPRNQLAPQIHFTSVATPLPGIQISPAEIKKQPPIKHKAVPLTAKAKRAIVLASQADNLDPKILELALTAHQEAKARGLVKKPLITVIDYSKPSVQKRLWVFDLKKNKLIYETYVSHGEGSGGDFATHFSNQQDSHQTSIGVFTTAETYEGMYGLSLKLDGRDKGFNDNARKRRIVMHGADFAREEYIEKHGVLGTSWACPSISDEIADQVINLIKGGSLIFSYYPDPRWLGASPFLNVD
jgi:hypothetical protein